MKNNINSRKLKACPRPRSGVKCIKLGMLAFTFYFLLSTFSFVQAQNTSPINLLPTTPNTPAVNQTPIQNQNGGGSPVGLAICTGAKDPANPNDNRPICDFNYFLQEGRAIINWLFLIAIPIAIVLFAYGGVLLIIGTPGNRNKAKDIFIAAGIGFGIMLIAWVSVYTIVSWLTNGSNSSSGNQSGITSFLGQ